MNTLESNKIQDKQELIVESCIAMKIAADKGDVVELPLTGRLLDPVAIKIANEIFNK